MIIQKLKKSEYYEDIAFGLFWGLAGGLAFGLAGGLAGGFIENIGIFSYDINLIWLLVGILIAVEILFWLDKEKLPKKSKRTLGISNFTIKKKLEAGSETLILFSVANMIIIVKEEAYRLQQYFPQIMKFLGWFGVIVLIIAGIWIWFKLNEVVKR